MISFFFLYALHSSRSTITNICITVDLDDIIAFCDAYTWNRGLEFYAVPRGRVVASEMRYREWFLERKARVDLSDIRRKKRRVRRAAALCCRPSVPRTPFG